jgi:hypothetical protein
MNIVGHVTKQDEIDDILSVIQIFIVSERVKQLAETA